MSSFGNDKPNAVRKVSVRDRSSNRNANNPLLQRGLKSVSSDTTSSSSHHTRRASSPSVQNVTSLQSRFKSLKVSCPPSLDNHGGRRERQHNTQGNLSSHPVLPQNGNLQGLVPQVSSQGMNESYIADNQYFHDGMLPSPVFQPIFQPIFHPTSPYYIDSVPPEVIYPSQYGLGGYPYNATNLPSFLHGYSPLTIGPNINSQVFGSCGSNTHEFDLPQINKFYGQLEFTPPFLDPLQFHPSFGDLYNVHGQLDPSASFDYGLPHLGVGVQVIDHSRAPILGIDHPGNSVNMGFYMPMPNCNLTSPVLPGSPIGIYNFPGGRSDVSSPSSSRSACLRGNDNANYRKPYSFLEELKSGKGRRFELSDISGHVIELSVDQHGSRFIQQKLEICSVEDKSSVFEELAPHACKLMTDVFGNYVIQKFFEYGTSDQRRDLAKTLAGKIIQLSLHTYGCRVLQKALDVIDLDQKIEISHELKGHVMRCVRDQNGNHVIQKCIECVPSERIGFIVSTFRGQVSSLSMHPYGCRVIQRVLEHCTDELQNQFIVDEIMQSVCSLTQDQYGNYVIQHVLEKGKPQQRTQIIEKLCGKVVKMSQHKFASNVVEKCLKYGDAPSRELLIAEVVGQTEGNDNLLVMMKDQYANYVVQRIFEKCAESQRELLLGRIRLHLNALKKYTYGKHIVARFEQLFGEIQEPASQ